MAKYRKKSLVIDAFRWTGGDDQKEDPEWINDAIRSRLVRFVHKGTKSHQMIIQTLEGNHFANPGDYIIKGINGELYPCKPDIFEATYEAI